MDFKDNRKDWVRVMVNSAYRNNVDDPTHNFKYDFEKEITRVSEIKVASVQIPFTYYTVRATNNILDIQEGATNFTLIIDRGFYTPQTLIQQLKTKLNAMDGKTLTYDVFFNTQSSKITITASGTFSINITSANNAAGILGYSSSATGTSLVGNNAILFDSSGTIYIASVSNNVVYLEEKTITGTPTECVLSPGNYSTTSFLAELKTQLEAKSPHVLTYTTTYSKTTHKITIAATDSFAIVTTGPNNAAGILGYNTVQTPAASHIGDNVLNISGTNTILVKSTALTESCDSTTVYSQGFPDKNILHSITVAALPGDYITEQPLHVSYDLNRQTTFRSNVDFRLEDEDGNLLNLNGAQWSLQLMMRVKAK